MGNGFAERGPHDQGGDPGVGADVQGESGAVVAPADDLHVVRGCPVGASAPVVGEVGPPGLVRHLGLKPEDQATKRLKITADGAWTVVIKDLTAAKVATT